MENTGTTSSDNSNTNNIKIFIGNNPVYDNKKYDDKITYIKEILSKALQIDNLNFLLGAGCSSYKVVIKDGNENTTKELGISTMIGLFYEFIEKNNFNFLDLTQEKIINALDKNLENLLEYLFSFELVISKFDDEKITLNNIPQEKLAEYITNAISSIKRFIMDAILSKTKSTEVIELYKSFYQKIINKNRKNPINIFTTNYDVYNETALDRLNFLYNNGFSGTVERKFNPMLYKYMYVENMNLNKDVWEPVSYFFNLIKLHGSITWEADKNNMDIFENTNLDTLSNEMNKVMIYPSPLKDRSTLMTPYSDLFRFLENSLFLNNSTLIVIGYSFGDDHINRVIYNALANPTFRLIIFGDSDNIKKLIERNDKRITIIYSENIEKSNDNNQKEKENEQNKQQSESKQVQLSDEEKQDNKQDSKENCNNTEQQPIHYFKSIVNDLLPSVNDDILEKERIDKIVKFLKENKLV